MIRRQLLLAAIALIFVATRAHATVGLADGYGYIWADQDEPYVDNSFPAATSGLNLVDVFEGGPMSSIQTMPDPFPFYELSYTSFIASDNGWLTFSTTVTDTKPTPVALPSATAAPLLIAPLWADLVPAAGSNSMWWTTMEGGGIHLRYSARYKSNSHLCQFHLGLFPNGVIKVYYEILEDPELVGVGIQRGPTQPTWFHLPTFLGAGRFPLEPGGVLMFFPPAKMSCAGAALLTCGSPTVTTSPPTLAANVTSYSCSADTYLGRERMLVWDNPGWSSLSLSLSDILPVGIDVDLLSIEPGVCSEFRCDQYVDAIDPTDILSLPLVPPGQYHFSVDGKGALDNGAFTVTPTCENRGQTTACGSRVSGTTIGTSLWDTYSCTPGRFSGPEYVFEVPFSRPGNLIAKLSNHTGADVDMFILNANDIRPTSCLAHGDEEIVLFNPPDGTYLIVIDGADVAGGGFDLSIECDVNLNCATAVGTLACETPTLGTTAGQSNDVERYSCTDTELLDGPEQLHTFVHGGGPISFALDGPPELRLQLVGSGTGCQEGLCLAAGTNVLTQDLPAGTYTVVVDGVDGKSGDYTLTPICQTTLSPELLEVTLDAGDCVTEHKIAYLRPEIDQVDLLFVIDTSIGQELTLTRLNTWSTNINARLAAHGLNLHYGLISFNDYIVVDKTTCGDPSYGTDLDYPYRLEVPMTPTFGDLTTGLAALVAENGGDLAEAYTRPIYEAVNDPAIGWRSTARRFVVITVDDVPHDCDVTLCIAPGPSPIEWGADPGRNGTLGDADDLEMLPVIDQMAADFIVPIVLFAPTSIPIRTDGLNLATIRQIWNCLAARAAGVTVTAGFGNLSAASLDEIEQHVVGSANTCRELTLNATTGFGPWLKTVTPPSRTDVPIPGTTTFDIEVCAPAGTTAGVYNFDVELECEGNAIASQHITALVSTCIFSEQPVGISGGSCRGSAITLDGSSSTIPGCTAGIEYRWLDLFRTPVAGSRGTWSTANSTYPTTLTFDFGYYFQFRCRDTAQCLGFGEVFVPVAVQEPIADAGLNKTTCVGNPVTIGTSCDGANTYLWDPPTDLTGTCPATVTPTGIPSPDGWTDYTVTVTDPGGCTAIDTVRVYVAGSRTPDYVLNDLRATKVGLDVHLDWTLRPLTPPEYNVHRTLVKTDLAIATLRTLILGRVDGSELWDDVGAVPAATGNLFYQVYMRDCDGSSLFP